MSGSDDPDPTPTRPDGVGPHAPWSSSEGDSWSLRGDPVPAQPGASAAGDSWSFGGAPPVAGPAAARPAPAPTPVRVGPYLLLAPLGQGGQGSVFRARSPGGREVALKVLTGLRPGGSPEQQAERARWRARFRREGEITAALRHRAIVRIHDAGEDRGLPYLVYELVPGGRTFGDALEDLPLEARLDVLTEVADALAQAHRRGLVHRDVKPGNILIDAEGRPRLTDFGLVRLPGSERLTLTGAMVGTPSHMAPEQLRGVRGEVGPAADVWALGVILYRCLTGSMPFEAQSLLELQARVLSGEVTPPRELDPTVPAPLERVCLRCLQADPRRRYRDAGALVRALRAARRDDAPPRGPGRLAAVATLGLSLGLLLVALVAALPGPAETSEAPPAAPDPVHTPVPAAPEAGSETRPPPPPPEEPPPPPSAPPEPFPASCRPYARGARTRLARAWGHHRGKHEALVNRVVFAPDGARAGSASEDGTARVWDLARGDELLRLQVGHPVGSVAFSGDGSLVLTGDASGAVRAWDARSGAPRAYLVPGEGPVNWVSPLSSGRILAAVSDGTVRLCRLEPQPRVERTYAAHPGGRVWSLAVAPDEAWFLSSGEDGAVRAWDLASGTTIATLAGHEGKVLQAVLSRDAWPRAATVDTLGWLRMWDAIDGDPLRAVRTVVPERNRAQGFARCAAFSPDGARLLTGGDDDLLHVFDVATGRELATLAGHRSWVNGLAVAPAGDRALTASNDQTVRLWDLATGRELWPQEGHEGRVTALAVRPGSPVAIFSSGYDGTVRRWEPDLPVERASLPIGGPGRAAPSPDGARLLVARYDVALALLDAADGQERVRAEPLRVPCHTLTWVAGAEAARPLTVQRDGRAALWSERGSRLVPGPTIDLGGLGDLAAAVDPGGTTLLTGGRAGAAVVDLGTGAGRRLERLGARGPVLAVAFVERERLLAGTAAGELILAPLAGGAGEPLATLDAPVTAVAVSPDGRTAVAAAGRALHVWDLEARREVDRLDLTPSGDRPEVLAFGPDGRWFVVGTSVGVLLRFELD